MMDLRHFLSSIVGICLFAIPVVFRVIAHRERARLYQIPPKNLRVLQRQLHREAWVWGRGDYLPASRNIPSSSQPRHWEERNDIVDLRIFNRQVEKGEDAPKPLMGSDLGRMYMKRYIDAYQAEHFGSLPYTSWKCFCGRIHPNHISICECGTDNGEMKTDDGT